MPPDHDTRAFLSMEQAVGLGGRGWRESQLEQGPPPGEPSISAIPNTICSESFLVRDATCDILR